MTTNLELYRAFYFTAKFENISKASEELYITQPAVSRAIKQLEEALECMLFIRTSKGVKLTQEGRILLQYIDQAFNFIESGEKKLNDVKNLLNGEIRIGASDTLCKHYLIPYLKLFKTLHPGIKIHVVCPTTPVISNLLKAGKIDFGIINMPFSDDKLAFKNIMKIQDCFVTGEKYRHLCLKVQPLSQLAANPILLLEKSSNTRVFIDKYLEDNNISIVPDFELGNMELLIQLARYDFGIACVIKNFIEDDLESGRLYEVKTIEKIPPRSIGVAWLKNVSISLAAKEFINNLDYFEASDMN